MSNYYVGQSLQIILDTNDSNLSSASVKQIKLKDPQGNETANTASITDTTKLTYTLPAASNTLVGTWRAQAYAEYSGSVVKIGDAVKFHVRDEFE